VLVVVVVRARSETVYGGMVYRHFFGGFEIILPLLAGRLPYRYAVGRSIAATFTVHSVVHEIWSVNCRKSIKIIEYRCVSQVQHMPKCVGGWGSTPDPAGGAYSTPPDP